MKQEIAITLGKDLIEFIDMQAQGNRSEYVNALTHQQRKQ